MISVCIATYNGASVILSQLNSILPQLGEEDEVIISDDRSTDGTCAVVEALHDPRVRIVQGPAKGSPIPNFEHALQMAAGDYIFLSDQDDKWLPGKVAVSIEKLRHGYDCVVTDCVVTDSDFHVTHPSFFALNHTHENRFYNLLVKNGYIGGCMAFTRRVRDLSLPFPANIPMHDMWIGNVAAFQYKVAFIHRPCSCFRRSGHNVSTSAGKSSNSYYLRFLLRLRVARGLLQLKKRACNV